jgi:hypothetical protein
MPAMRALQRVRLRGYIDRTPRILLGDAHNET